MNIHVQFIDIKTGNSNSEHFHDSELDTLRLAITRYINKCTSYGITHCPNYINISLERHNRDFINQYFLYMMYKITGQRGYIKDNNIFSPPFFQTREIVNAVTYLFIKVIEKLDMDKVKSFVKIASKPNDEYLRFLRWHNYLRRNYKDRYNLQALSPIFRLIQTNKKLFIDGTIQWTRHKISEEFKNEWKKIMEVLNT